MKTSRPAHLHPRSASIVCLLMLFAVFLSSLTVAAPLPAIAARDAAQADVSQIQAPTADGITATLTAALAVDNARDEQAGPGDTLRYTLAVSNTGTADTTNLVISDTLDANTSLVAGSVRVSPLAIADSYNAQRNTPLTITAPGLLANDTGTPAPTVTPSSGPTTAGGTVTVSADGGFTYTPASGYSGTDSFSYTATNSSGSDSSTVVIAVENAPAVVSTTPANGATNVPVDGTIIITFSEPVNVTASAFLIECPSGTPIAFTNTTGSGPATSFTIDPASDLPAGVICTVTVAASQVTDVDTIDPPDTMAANYSFSFTTTTTGDAAPSVLRTTPANGAINVQLNSAIVITFTEAVNLTANAFRLECPRGVEIGGTTTASPASIFTFTPARNLSEGVICTFTVLASQVSDVDALDPPDTMAADYVLSFTTFTKPRIVGPPSPSVVASSARAQQRAAIPAAVTTTPGSVQVDLATLPIGKHVVVIFDVLIANSLPKGVTTISNQATISASNITTLLTDDPATAAASDPTITPLIGRGKAYLPLVAQLAGTASDLVVISTSVSPAKTSFSADEPVLITVVIKNQGSAAAAPFWVDLYLNPAQPPALNQIWNFICGLNPCYGIAWRISEPLAPGASLTLTSASTSYAAPYTRWPGTFAAGTTDVYVLADSWNPGLTSGASGDQNLSNNLFHVSGLSVTGPNPSAQSTVSDLPARPAAR